jgi:putative Mn2+ efflux pump MntP
LGGINAVNFIWIGSGVRQAGLWIGSQVSRYFEVSLNWAGAGFLAVLGLWTLNSARNEDGNGDLKIKAKSWTGIIMNAVGYSC